MSNFASTLQPTDQLVIMPPLVDSFVPDAIYRLHAGGPTPVVLSPNVTTGETIGGQIGGRMLASTVFEDEELLVYNKQVSVVRLPAAELEGNTLADAAVQTVTGCTVVAIVRNGEIITDFDPASFRFEVDDEVIIAGIDENITRFERRFNV